jgi:hypothetical protein
MIAANPLLSPLSQIRESIRALFPRRDCFTLVRPVHDEQQLQRLDALAPAALRPEFKAGLDQLTSLIFEHTHPKQMEGVTLTGPMLAALAQSFVGAINQGAVPTIATSWQVHPFAPLVSSLAIWILTVGGPALDQLPLLRHAGGSLMHPDAV